MILRFSIVAVLGFAAGVAARDQAQGWYEVKKAEQTAEQVRTCMGYLVVTSDGKTTECRYLQPRLDLVWPIPGDPIKLKKKEIKRAIGG